ncbi:MAG: hypothetical protein HDR71_13340 [Lachnospiraceae bacterium]|nr:hypothetical protein [Lachnospiraceae bacterium]
MKKSILYYPSINIVNTNWLRGALFYWDNIHTIVPNNYDLDKLSPDLKYLFKKGIYKPISPDVLLQREEYKLFEYELIYRFSGHSYYDNTLNDMIHHIDPECNIFYMHKLGNAQALHYLVENMALKKYIDDCVLLDSQIHFEIMNIMTKYMVQAINNDVNNDSYVISGTDVGNAYEGIYGTSSHDARFNTCCFVNTLNKILPVPLDNTPFERIIDFRQERRSELLKLRQTIDNYENKIAKCNDIASIKKIMLQFEEEILYESENTKRLMRGKKITWRLSSARTIFEIGVPDMLLAISNLPTSLKILGCVANGAISLGKTYADVYFEKKELLCNSYVSYLYNANKFGLIDFYDFN